MSTTATPEDLVRENAELRARLQRLERMAWVVQASNEAIVSSATDGTIVCWNAAAERLYGFTIGEAIGRSDLELVPFERLAEHESAVDLARRGASIVLETRRRRRDGSQVSVAITYARLTDPDGKLLGISTIAHALLV
ncbi:MAG TPA: PAS domain-containing protein [Kofleriaceae bacterium]